MATITAMPRYAHGPRSSISGMRSTTVGGPSGSSRPRHRPTASASSINKIKAAAAASVAASNGTPPSRRTSLSVSPSQHAIPEDTPVHPFANTTSLLTVIRDEPINVEEEARFYDEFESDDDKPSSSRRSFASDRRSSIMSHDIWLEHHDEEEDDLFARDVKINGWTSVGDYKRGGAYIVYDCAVTTKDGVVIHVLKRYSAFFELQLHLLRTLPRDVRHFLPTLPPKSPLARYRSAFLERRRKALQLWLTQVCLHPDIGGTKAVKEWIVENN